MKFLKKPILVIVLLILLQTIKTAQLNEELPENYCSDDSYCDPPYRICNLEKNRCRHKDLFPLTMREVVGVFVLIIFCGIAVISGRAGGPMIIPVLKGFFMFDLRDTLALSNGLIVINTIGKFVTTVYQKDTDARYTHMPMINYGLSIICAPMLLIGNWLGYFLNQILPKPILLMLVLAVLGIGTFIAYDGYLKVRQKEIDEEKKNLEEKLKPILEEKLLDEEPKKEPRKFSDICIPPTISLNLESHESPMHKLDNNSLQIIEQAGYNKKSIGEGLEEILSKKSERGASKDIIELQEFNSFEQPKDEVSMKLSKNVDESNQKEIDKIKELEARTFPLNVYFLILAIVLISIAVAIFMGTKKTSGFITVHKCSGMFYMMGFIYILFSMIIAFIVGYNANQLYKRKLEINFFGKDIDERENWSVKKLLIINLLNLSMGCIAGMVGFGGGFFMLPLFTKLGYSPIVANSTFLFTVLYSKISITTIFYLNDQFQFSYLLFLGFFIIVSSMAINYYIMSYIKKNGKQSFLLLSFC